MAAQRIDLLERRVDALSRRLERLEGRPAPARRPEPAPAPVPARQAPPFAAPPRRTERPERITHPPGVRTRVPSASDGVDSLLTARTLAWAGGIVLMLGMILFFAIAVDRGWIDEGMRVAMGGAFSLGLLGASAVLRGRYGRLEAGQVAAGAAIGGLFFTDLAATSLYDLIPDSLGIVLAAAIAVLAVGLALAWSTQAISALGLAGMIASAPVIAEDVTMTTLAVVAIAQAAALGLMFAREWRWPAAIAVAGSAPQALVWIEMSADAEVRAVTIAAGFWAMYTAGGFAWALLRRRGALDPMSGSLTLAGAAFAVSSIFLIVSGEDSLTDSEGIAFAALGAAYVLFAPALWALNPAHRGEQGARDLRTLTWALGLALIGSALPILFEDRDLLAAFGVGAALLAAASRLLDHDELGLAALAYLGTAAIVMLVEAPPALLFDDGARPESGLADVAVLGAAAGAVALALREPVLRAVAGWSSAAVAVYLGSLAILALFSSPDAQGLSEGFLGDEPSTSFQRAQTMVSIFWGLVGIGALLEGLRRDLPGLRAAGGVLLVCAVGKAFLYDLSYLTAFARALSFLGLGSVLLVAAFLYQRLSQRLRLNGA